MVFPPLPAALAAEVVREKRQDDKDPADVDEKQTAEQLCENRAPDEYFRLTTEGDCRDVVR